MNLSGKTVLLTGATGGIGSATAGELSSRGASIIAVGRRTSCLALLSERLRSSRCDIVPIAADIADPAQRDSLVAAVLARAKKLDILINCAGNRLEVVRMAYALRVRQDEPRAVAARVVSAIETDRDNRYFGWRERFFVRLNSILPRLFDMPFTKRVDQMRPFAPLPGRP